MRLRQICFDMTRRNALHRAVEEMNIPDYIYIDTDARTVQLHGDVIGVIAPYTEKAKCKSIINGYIRAQVESQKITEAIISEKLQPKLF